MVIRYSKAVCQSQINFIIYFLHTFVRLGTKCLKFFNDYFLQKYFLTEIYSTLCVTEMLVPVRVLHNTKYSIFK